MDKDDNDEDDGGLSPSHVFFGRRGVDNAECGYPI
jgi:hypothetical protein